MKTHEFAKYLDQLAFLLRQLPDVELDLNSSSTLQNFFSSMAVVKKKTSRSPTHLPLDIEKRLAQLSPAEIESLLLSEAEGFTVANLLELTERMGLSVSKRAKKNALVNIITRHYEALKMHSIMRTSDQNKS